VPKPNTGIVERGESGWRGLASALNRPIVVLLLLQLMGGMMFSPHRTFFPIYAKELGYSAVLIATLATVRQLMGLFASLVGGTLSDSLGRKWTLLLGYVGFLLGGLIFLTPSAGWIAVLWALSGFGMGLHTLGGQSYLMDTAHPRYLGLLTAFYNWGYTLGGTLSSPVTGFLLDRWNYQVFGIALTAFALVAIAVNLFSLPRSPARTGRGAASWKKLFGYGDLASRRPVIALVAIRFLPTFYWGMALVFIPLLLAAAGATKMVIALYATVSQVVASLAQGVVGHAADRFGSKWPTVITFSVLVLSILGTGILPGQLWSIFAFGTLGAAAAWSFSTLLPTLVAQVTEPAERGRVLGWIHLWWNLAMIVGSMVGGVLFEWGMGLPFLVAGVLNLLSIVLAFLFFQTKASPLDQESTEEARL
jgi:MFS family permease